MRASILILAVVACAGWGLLLLEVSENKKATFATLAAAEAAGMMSAGWLLEYLPRSTVHITEGRNIDTNRVWASFSFSPGDTSLVESACKKVAESKDGAKFLCPPFEGATSTVVLKSNGEGHYLSYENGI